MDEIKLENRLTRLEENVDVMGEEIVDLQENQAEIKSLALAVNTLAVQVKRLVDDLCSTNSRLDLIESRPRKWLDTIISLALGAIIGGAIAYITGGILG